MNSGGSFGILHVALRSILRHLWEISLTYIVKKWLQPTLAVSGWNTIFKVYVFAAHTRLGIGPGKVNTNRGSVIGKVIFEFECLL